MCSFAQYQHNSLFLRDCRAYRLQTETNLQRILVRPEELIELTATA